MGIGRLVVVDPPDCDVTRILKMATHVPKMFVAEMEIVDSLRDALAAFPVP